MIFIAIAIVSYLIGSLPAGYLIARMAGLDIRNAGSGNIGATNVVRVLGKRYGYPVFIVDFTKGIAAIGMSILAARRWPLTPNSAQLLEIVAAVSCILGHTFPIWLGFKGGKGVATSAGVLIGLMPLAAAIVFTVWIVTFEVSRYVSLASIIAALTLPITIAIMIHLKQVNGMVLLYFSICMAAVIIARHRSNLSRLLRGTEPRFRRK